MVDNAVHEDAPAIRPWPVVRSEMGVRARTVPGADLADLRHELEVARVAERIQRLVDGAPPLTDDQRAALVALLRGGESR